MVGGLGSGHLERRAIEILKILSNVEGPVGARLVARELGRKGYRLNERTIRYHMRILDEKGFTKNLGYDGRILTPKGSEEIRRALITDRMGFVLSKIESLIYNMDFKLEGGRGRIIVNLGVIDKEALREALKVMKRVMEAGYSVSPLIRVLEEGERFENYTVPPDKAVLTTVCSITLDGILHKAGIPVSPKFGGVVQVVEKEALRFTDAVWYSGSTLDPLDILAVKGLTSVWRTVETGSGQILANLREIPMEAVEKAKESFKAIGGMGFGGVLKIGEPNEPILGVNVSLNRVGIAIVGGTNPLTALNERGIRVETRAVEGMMEFGDLTPIQNL